MPGKSAYLLVCLWSFLVAFSFAASPLGAAEAAERSPWASAPTDDSAARAVGEDGSKPFAIPKPTLSLGALALGSLALGAPAAGEFEPVDEDADFEEPSWPSPSASRKKRGTTFSANFNFTGYPWTEFQFADVKDGWDSAWKYELNISGHYGLSGNVEPFGGAYFSYEEREWEDGSASIKSQVFSIGAELGALLYAMEKADKHPINFPIVPFFRVGLGFNQGDYKNVPTGDDLFMSGDLDGLRFEIAGGVDVRLIIAQRIMLGIGAGVCYWNSFNVGGVTRNGVGVIVIGDDKAGFEGLDVFARLTLGLLF